MKQSIVNNAGKLAMKFKDHGIEADGAKLVGSLPTYVCRSCGTLIENSSTIKKFQISKTMKNDELEYQYLMKKNRQQVCQVILRFCVQFSFDIRNNSSNLNFLVTLDVSFLKYTFV